MVKSLKLAFAILAIGAASAQAEERAQFYIPDKPAKLVYLFTCKGETVEEVNENWAKAQAVFAQNHQKLAAELETETRAQRETRRRSTPITSGSRRINRPLRKTWRRWAAGWTGLSICPDGQVIRTFAGHGALLSFGKSLTEP